MKSKSINRFVSFQATQSIAITAITAFAAAGAFAAT